MATAQWDWRDSCQYQYTFCRYDAQCWPSESEDVEVYLCFGNQRESTTCRWTSC